MFHDVVQGFLKNPEQRDGLRVRYVQIIAGLAYFAGDAGAFGN